MSVKGEHEFKATFSTSIFYINEPEPRTASPTFAHMKRTADKAGAVCAISGQPHPQYHHIFCEYAARDEIDWVKVKNVALGIDKTMPVLDIDTDQPTSETFPADQSLLFKLCKFAETCFGMDWNAFDPANPIEFVDSIHNMLPLHAKFHIHKEHGIHLSTFPEWVLHSFPKMVGFVMTQDEEDAIEKNKKLKG